MSIKNKLLSSFATIVLLSSINIEQANAEQNNSENNKINDSVSSPVSNNEIEKAKEELNEITNELIIKETEKESLDLALLKLKDEKEILINKLNYLLEHLDNKEKELIKQNEELSDLKNGIEEIKKLLSEREDEFKKRLNTLYKEHMTSDTKLLEVFINSDGFFDLINNYVSYKKIVGKDNDMVLKYVSLIQKLEDDTESVEKLIVKITEKVKEVEELVTEVEKTIEEKVEVEYLLNSKIKEKDKELLSLDGKVSTKEEEISKLIEDEKIRIEKEKEERIKMAEDMKKNFSNKDTVTYSDLSNLEFEGDSDFQKYQKSVNWMRGQVGKSALDDYYKIIDKYSKITGLPSALIKGIIMTESTFQTKTTNVNRNGTIDRGLMQMNSGTAPSVASDLGLVYEVGMEFIPETNIKMATHYISKYYTPDNIHKGLTSYNRGPTGAKNWNERNVTYVTEYSEKVIGYMKVFLAEENK